MTTIEMINWIYKDFKVEVKAHFDRLFEQEALCGQSWQPGGVTDYTGKRSTDEDRLNWIVLAYTVDIHMRPWSWD